MGNQRHHRVLFTSTYDINLFLPSNANEIKLHVLQNQMYKYGQQNIKLEFMYDKINLLVCYLPL